MNKCTNNASTARARAHPTLEHTARAPHDHFSDNTFLSRFFAPFDVHSKKKGFTTIVSRFMMLTSAWTMTERQEYL
jgi:hypothetical protein